MRKYFGVIAAALLLNGCSNQQLYNSTQGAKENECQKIIDAGERTRCLDNAHMPYEKYRQQREDSIKN